MSKHGRYNIEKTDIASAFLVVKKVVTDKKKKEVRSCWSEIL